MCDQFDIFYVEISLRKFAAYLNVGENRVKDQRSSLFHHDRDSLDPHGTLNVHIFVLLSETHMRFRLMLSSMSAAVMK